MKKSMNKKRLPYIDYIKAIGIILVIIGHINFANADCKTWIYSFHMPLFFFASGLVVNVKKKRDKDIELHFLYSKIGNLLYPYFVWAIIYAPLSIKNLLKILYGSYESIIKAKSLSSLWFLPVMFLTVCFFELFVYIQKKTKIQSNLFYSMIIIITFMIGLILPNLEFGYPMGIDVVFTSLGFYSIGHFIRPAIDYVRKKEKKYIILPIVCIITFVLTLSYQWNEINENSYILMATAQYGNYLLFVTCALCGCLFIASLSLLLEYIHNQKFTDILTYIGRNTLIIFFIHKLIINICKIGFNYFESIPTFCVLGTTTCITLIVCIVISYLINKYCSFLLVYSQTNRKTKKITETN